jgi:ABC-type multidrug transport system fused ATPase/permease subunit
MSYVDNRTEILIQLVLDNLMNNRTNFVFAQQLSSIRTPT